MCYKQQQRAVTIPEVCSTDLLNLYRPTIVGLKLYSPMGPTNLCGTAKAKLADLVAL